MFVHDGKEYARVTEILQVFCDFSHIDPVVLGRKQIIGTMTHKAIEDWIMGNFPILSPSIEGYFTSFLKWHDILKCDFGMSEHRFFCEEKRITGQIDCLVNIRGEKLPVMVDFKTSAQESSSWVLQGHLYRYLLEKNGIESSPRMLFLKLEPTGKIPRVFEYKFEQNTLYKCFDAIENFWANHSKT